jgi:hypothetical protein
LDEHTTFGIEIIGRGQGQWAMIGHGKLCTTRLRHNAFFGLSEKWPPKLEPAERWAALALP